MVVVVTLAQFFKILLICICAIICIGCIVPIVLKIVNWYNRTFRKNCFECRNYYLSNVASYGDCCWFKCKKHNEFDDRHSMNDRYYYRKCNDFESEVEKDESNSQE